VTHSGRRPVSPAALASRLSALLACATLVGGLLAVPAVAAEPAPDASAAPSREPSLDPRGEPSIEPSLEPSVEPATPPTADPAPDVPTETAPDDAAEPAGGLLPTVHYEEALAHANDRIRFTPGERVTVGFEPRAADTWPVDGRRPQALPAGNASGLEIAASRQGSRWAVGAPATLDDTAALDPSTLTVAETTSLAGTATDEPLDTSASGLRRQVFGFLPYWELSDSSTKLDYSVLSTIAYFSVGADKNGNLLKKNSDGSTTTGWGGWSSSRMTNVITNAHANGTRVVLTITMFAWTSSQKTTQAAFLGNSTARLNLARQAAAAVRDRGADGINLDFEPIVSGYADEYTAFVRTVRAELNKIASGYQLTFDTTGYVGNYPIAEATAAGGADAIFVMGYDYRTASSNPVGSISPLGGTAYDLVDTIKAYTAKVPASRLIMGVPYYGRAWSTDSDALHAKNISGTKYGSSVTAIYTTAIELAAQHGRKWDSVEKSPWIVYRRETCTSTYGCVTSWRQLYYDDATSLKAKYDVINAYGLRGAGIWALGYDDGRSELNAALKDKFAAPLITGSSLSSAWFSPDGDGVKDAVRVSVTASSVSSWIFTATPISSVAAAAPLRTVEATGTPALNWDGRTDGGDVSPDGAYRLTLTVTGTSGATDSRSWDVTIDTVDPAVTQAASPSTFSPNGDGVLDTTSLTWLADEHVAGKVRIRSGSTSLKIWAIGTKGSLVWDGRTASGPAAADGRYVYQVDVSDGAGNRTVREIPVAVDRTVSRLAWSPALFFPQDRDAYATGSTVSFKLSRTAVTTLQLYSRSGTYVRTAWSNRTTAAGTWSYRWNGVNAKGEMVPRGWYFARLVTVSPISTTIQTRLVLVDAYSIVPSSWSPAGGTTLTVTIRTAEPLSASPRVTFTQAGRSAVAKTATSLGGGRYRVTFSVVAGATGRATVGVSGRDAGGRANSQTINVTVR
jgi:spore germination protein YaaH/flagellar hook assembly protein FlgD